MATIAFFQNRLGRTDGVSREVDKWKAVLQGRLGHQVWYCTGNPEIKTNYVLDELYAQHPKTWKILRNSTVRFQDYASEQELERDIYEHADVIEAKLLRFIEEKGISLLAPNNLCSGGYQPAAAIAFHRVFRKTGPAGEKIYSLWDSYVLADFVTYPSTWEGWGNQFIEAVFARLPVVLFEHPVWGSDLKKTGFDVVSLGRKIAARDKHGLVSVPRAALESAADEIVAILTNPKRRREMGEKNFALGREQYSLAALETILRRLLAGAGV